VGKCAEIVSPLSFLRLSRQFTAINDMTRDADGHPELYRPDVPRNDEPGSVLKMLRQQSLDYPNCQSLPRLQMCYTERDEDRTRRILLPKTHDEGNDRKDDAESGGEWYEKDFLTQNFVLGDSMRSAKAMVNVGGLSDEYMMDLDLLRDGNPHEPAPGHCQGTMKDGWELAINQTLLTAYHYSGTDEQRMARVNDVRGKYKAGGTKKPDKTCRNRVPADDLRPWLRGFVDLVGREEAERLLEGVGGVGIWPEFDRASLYRGKGTRP